ncbi:N-acetylmuramoyl-L-alanine amidase family protein [Sporosarcina sp. FSL W7-1283]|uniref:N-acetylmuramoyl-L-alanine amidase family protein n=1 Tax=Sporosarcina sp. FSL W7-1283 TaxID=2921560 RepID=UPI0030F87CBF
MVKILIDPGHGGHDSGAGGARSYEKNNVLKVALRMKTLLQQHGHTVNLTRETDVYLTLSQRAAAANKWGADIFVSLHDNSATNKTATGFETFIFDKTSNAKTIKLQGAIHNALIKEIGLRDRGMKRANFAVLRETNMPACLVEYAFISNNNDESLLITEVDKLARLTAKGINDYFGIKTVVATPSSSKEDDELRFSSPALKAETELTLGSKARRKIIVNAAVKACAHESWQKKLEDGQIIDVDLLGLAAKYIIDTNK